MPSQELKTQVHFYLSAISRASDEIALQMRLINKYQELIMHHLEADMPKPGIPMAPPSTTPAEDSIRDSKTPHEGGGSY